MKREVFVFVLLAYGLTWASWMPLVLSGAVVTPGALPTHLPGLAGPAVAAALAALLSGGRPALRTLGARVFHLRIGILGLLVALSPLVFLAVGALVQLAMSGSLPALAGMGRYSGLPEVGVLPVAIMVFLANGLGEEVGWRGFALPRLQSLFGPVTGTLVLFPIWAFWHLPTFWFLQNFMQMDLITLLFGWSLGLFAGNLVIANVTRLAGGSVLAAALWHTGYNLAAGTDLGGAIPAVATTFVMIWATGIGYAILRRKGGDLLDVRPQPYAQ